jgi:hypothetical protein
MLRRLLPLIAVAAIAGAASAQPAPTETRLFELRTYHAPDGQLDALHARFREHAVGLFEKYGIANVGYWTPSDAAGSRVVFLLAYPSADARNASWARLVADPQWRKCRRDSEGNGKLVERIEELMLVPTADCPVVAPSRGDAPRSFELRTYATKPGDGEHHKALCEKFRDSLVGCWTAATGQSGGTTHVYLLARERPATDRHVPEVAASDKFRISATVGSQQPAIRSRPAAADGGKGLVLQPTDYSPLR